MKSWTRIGAACFALALVTAACGDDDDDDGAADTTAAAETTAGGTDTTAGGTDTTAGGSDTTAAPADTPCLVSGGEEATGEPIKVGSIQSKTGPDDFSSSGQGAKAFFECVNANGGINGRPVDFILGDDEWSPEKAAQLGAKMIEDDNVVAFVGSSSFVECGANAASYITAGIVAVYGVGVPRECFEAENVSATNAGPRISALGAVQYMKEKYDIATLTCVSQNIPNTGGWVCDGVEKWGAEAGVEVRTILHDPASADFTSIIQDAVSDNPDGVLLMEPAGLAIPLLAAAEEQDLREKHHWAGPTSFYDADFPAAIGDYWNGYLTVQAELNTVDSTGPDNTAWLATLDEYGNADDPRDTFSQAGWLAAKIFTDTLLDMDPESITRESVTEALRAINAYPSDLACVPWYFGPGKTHNANHAGRIVEIDDSNNWVLAKDCHEVEDPDLAEILALEASEGLGAQA